MGNYCIPELYPFAYRELVQMVRKHIDDETPPLVTYGGMASRLTAALGRPGANVNHRHVGRVIGGMMEAVIDRYGSIPPINVLVVNAGDGLPGEGAHWFLEPEWCPNDWWLDASSAEKKALIKDVWDACRDFADWDRISGMFDVDAAMDQSWEKQSGSKERDGKIRRLCGGGPAESLEHRRLKFYLKAHPEQCGAPAANSKGRVEYRFPSLDEADVRFSSRHHVRIIEAKSRISDEVDLRRGLYQCIKYQALAEAEEKEKETGQSVTTALAVENLKPPRAISDLADMLGIEILRVDRDLVDEWGDLEENEGWQHDGTASVTVLEAVK
ncbi:hypothetical protein [Caenispirillum salinarum]|uniref:hypothetical protein n=1 Tax=Caenispirillum salinarum TaxID=859058 RepID=UPI003850010C